jgi:16S rRNA C1402 (ribose-2'-O) methylase RsmI
MYYTVYITSPSPYSVSEYNNHSTEICCEKIKMSKELLLHQQEHVNPLQNEEEKEEENKRIIHNNIEQEIECPRCHDIMALSSDFDRLSYVCQECNLSLILY